MWSSNIDNYWTWESIRLIQRAPMTPQCITWGYSGIFSDKLMRSFCLQLKYPLSPGTLVLSYRIALLMIHWSRVPDVAVILTCFFKGKYIRVFLAIYGYLARKIPELLRRTICRFIFRRLRRNWIARQQARVLYWWKQMIVGRGQVSWVRRLREHFQVERISK